jgi:hypothetical protein
MKKFFCCFIFWVAGIQLLQADDIAVEITTDPSAENILPDAEMVTLKIVLKHSDGRLVEKARLHFRITAPEKNKFFSTDFPIVEGTELLDVRPEISGGVFTMKYLFPIRGDYRLQVKVEALKPEDFETTEVQKILSVNEVPEERWHFKILLFVLSGFGLFSGFLLGRSGRRQPLEEVS